MKFFARGLSWHCGDIHIMHDGTDITNKRTIHFLREHADFGKEFYAKGQEEITEEINVELTELGKKLELYAKSTFTDLLNAYEHIIEIEKIFGVSIT